MKKEAFFFVLLWVVLAAVPGLWQCKHTKKTGFTLLTGNLEFRLPGNAEERFKQLAAAADLAKHFKQNRVNVFFEKNKWIGRVKENDVSYHALFAVDDSKIICHTANPNANGLLFSIYHPMNSTLTYTVSIENKNSRKNVFRKSFDGETKHFYDGYISFDKPFKGDTKIIFETAGRGVAAWVNPGFHRAEKNPRIFIMMVLDTLRYDHSPLYGYHRKTTPFLEKLAADGVTFHHAFSTTSWTLPAHVSLFSGKDLSGHGVVAPKDVISENYPLVAEIFQMNGFVTAAFTGGGFVEDSYGFYRGFQYYSNAPGSVFSMDSAERVFRHFKNYMKRRWGNNLFIFLHTYQMHSPYKAPRPYVEKINKNIKGNLQGVPNFIKKKHEYFKPLAEADRQRLIDLYDASILYTDEALVGNVVRFLKQKGAYENAMIVVLSDHGEEFYDHGSWEHGHTLYNELIKIPLVIKYPLSKNKKGIENALVSIADIPAMMLRESGLNYDENDFKIQSGRPGGMLPVLLPVSPIIKQFLTKVSFIDDSHYFIYNRIDEKKMAFFNPPHPGVPVYELYRREDLEEKHNVYKKNFKKVASFKKPLKMVLEKLKQLKRKQKRLDKDLEKKLKSLGYLGN